MEIDFTALNEELNNAAECRVEGCAHRVPDPDSICQRCFMGLMLGDVVWDEDKKCDVRKDLEED